MVIYCVQVKGSLMVDIYIICSRSTLHGKSRGPPNCGVLTCTPESSKRRQGQPASDIETFPSGITTKYTHPSTMPRLPISEQALRLALTRPAAASRPSQYVCRACVRQYHPSPAFRAELPFWKRMTNSLFGSTEQNAAAEKRDEAHQNRLNELAEQGGGKTETFVDDQGREWTIAAVVDPSINKEYVQAQRWDGLEWVGSKEWIARRSDAGETYIG
jgi:hypothetical protein